MWTKTRCCLTVRSWKILPGYECGSGRSLFEEPNAAEGEGSEQYFSHVLNFLACVKNHYQPNSDVESSHLSTNITLLTNIPFHIGCKVYWNATTEEITGDPEVEQLLGRQYRSGYKV